jgi:hypothetical protein
MRTAGRDLLTAPYDYAANITAFMQANAPWATTQPRPRHHGSQRVRQSTLLHC